MKTKFDVGDHVLIPFEVDKITIVENGKALYRLTADYSPYSDIITVEENDMIKIVEEE